MSRHPLIEGYLHSLRGLPGDVVDEIADGLIESYEHHRARGCDPDGAARATITEFGPAGQVIAAFAQIAPGRRVSRLLLATGPLVGLCWGAALLTAHAWTWPAPGWVPPLFGVALAACIGTLLTAAFSRRIRRAALFAGTGLIVLDALVISTALAVAPTTSSLLWLAVLVSLARICFTAHALPQVRSC
jgi:hypothetical protein